MRIMVSLSNHLCVSAVRHGVMNGRGEVPGMRSSDDDPVRPLAADQFRSQVHLGEYLVYVKSTLTEK